MFINSCNNMETKVFAHVTELDSDVEFDYKTKQQCLVVEDEMGSEDEMVDSILKVNALAHKKVEEEWAAWEKEQEMRQWEIEEFEEEIVSQKVEDVIRPPITEERQREFDEGYKEFVAWCRFRDAEDARIAQEKENFFGSCMNELYDIDRPLFEKIASGNFEEHWFSLYERAMKQEATRKRLAEEKAQREAEKKKDEERRKLLIRKGVCNCPENTQMCTCGALIFKGFYEKRRKKKRAKAAKRKAAVEAKKEEKKFKLKVAAREAFLEKKALEEKRWKESFAYQDALRLKKQREESGNVILQNEESDSEMEKLENDTSLEEEEKTRRIEEHLLFKEEERNAQFECFMDAIVKHDEKVKIEEADAKAKAEDEKTWTTSIRKKPRKSGKTVEKKKKEVKRETQNCFFERLCK